MLRYDPVNEDELGLFFGYVQLLKQIADFDSGFNTIAIWRWWRELLQSRKQFDLNMRFHYLLVEYYLKW